MYILKANTIKFLNVILILSDIETDKPVRTLPSKDDSPSTHRLIF